MAFFKYISDPLYLDVELPDSFYNETTSYEVRLYPYNYTENGYKYIYTGSLFYNGPTKIYLNDIIAPHMDDYKWFKDIPVMFREQYKNFNTEALKYNYVRVDFKHPYYGWQTAFNVLNATRTPNMPKEEAYMAETSVKSLYEYGNKILPKLPVGTKLIKDVHGNVDSAFCFPIKFFTDTRETSAALYVKKDGADGTMLTPFNLDKFPVTPYIISYVDISSALIGTAWDYDKLAIKCGDSYTYVAELDKNPADYYLIWINRYGATQCQPFCKKNTLSESVTTTYGTTLLDEKVPFNKSVEYKWTLNSHWLTYAEHDEFESLLTSKYVWLYDYNTGLFHAVNVANTDWTYKNPKYNKKPFNMTVNLTTATPQNITY